MNLSEIRELSIEELKEKISQEKSALNSAKLSHSVSPLEDALQLKNARKAIARLSTVLTEKINEK